MPVSKKWFEIFKIIAHRLTTDEYEKVTKHIWQSYLIDGEYILGDICGMQSDIANAKHEADLEKRNSSKTFKLVKTEKSQDV